MTEPSRSVPGASLHSAVYHTPPTILQGDLISFLSYVKSQNIPILPVTLPDVRSCLGQGASFLVNGAEMPETYVDEATGTVLPKGLMVAFKRAMVKEGMTDIIADRINRIFNEVLIMCHPPLLDHPNIVKLLGIGFEVEGPAQFEHVMPVIIPECAELGNLAEVLETARKEDQLLSFEEKLSLCIDVAHGLDVLHSCDIVHGDVKCENVLVFKKDRRSEDHGYYKTPLTCKLTDFGISRHPSGGLIICGSLPWQAPECFRCACFKVENAKFTDVYSFGMLLWRVMLNGDPFKSLGEFSGKTEGDKRQQRNDAVALLKEGDQLVEHVCNSLTTSGIFSTPQLEMLYEVIKITLIKDPTSRELDMRRIIRLLAPDYWYQNRNPATPTRISMDIDIPLLDIEKYYFEFQKTSDTVKARIARGFRVHAEAFTGRNERGDSAAFQLAICYATGFGVPFQPVECLKWLKVAAAGGCYRAQRALPLVAEAFDLQIEGHADTSAGQAAGQSATPPDEEEKQFWDFLETGHSDYEDEVSSGGGASDKWSVLSAAEACRYDILEHLLSTGAEPNVSEDRVTALHYLSSWDVDRAEELGRKLIQAGVDVNAEAKQGVSIGGTPLMWSIHGDHVAHSEILIKLGADPTVEVDGVDAFSLVAQLHLASHLQLLLRNVRPTQLVGRLLTLAATGEGQFARITRHRKKWKTAPVETFKILQGFYSLFPEDVGFTDLLLAALKSSLNSGYGRMNTDIQKAFINEAGIGASQLSDLLRESVVGFNQELFNFLLDRNVSVMGTFEGGKTLLHLCALIPDHKAAATAFAPRLLNLGASIEAKDTAGYTPFIDAVVGRKWELADLLLAKGAEPLATNNRGDNALGVCIQTTNRGSIKYLLKYSPASSSFHASFLTNPRLCISALQQAANLAPAARDHHPSMEIEAQKTLLLMLKWLGTPNHIAFRSSGILPHANALQIASSVGNLLAVKSLLERDIGDAGIERAVRLASARLAAETDRRARRSLEMCVFVLQNWEGDREGVAGMVDSWTGVDGGDVGSGWEVIT
ncbi:MAG: hypothetical protein M1840_004910 [Geoglossum simile]|nr:MAG: hypothetical protein M1840_004910 [Geoglossum simile]